MERRSAKTSPRGNGVSLSGPPQRTLENCQTVAVQCGLIERAAGEQPAARQRRTVAAGRVAMGASNMVRAATAVGLASLALLAGCGQKGKAEASSERLTSAREFVQRFYKWYAPTALRHTAVPAFGIALSERPSAFSHALLRALEVDSDAQANAEGIIVGLDFDPFLAAQDPCERYKAGEATWRAGHYLVPVYGVCSGKRHAKPDVVAEVGRVDQRWVFLDFRYPGNPPGLMAVLETLREERAKHQR